MDYVVDSLSMSKYTDQNGQTWLKKWKYWPNNGIIILAKFLLGFCTNCNNFGQNLANMAMFGPNLLEFLPKLPKFGYIGTTLVRISPNFAKLGPDMANFDRISPILLNFCINLT